MKYVITVTSPGGKQELDIADNIEDARDDAHDLILERMAAFSEDREALERYGYAAAEEWALDLPPHGGECKLSDGWEIEVVPKES